MRWGGPAEKRLAGSAALNPQSLPYFAPPEATANPGTALLYLDRQRAVLRRAHSPSAVVHTVATSAYRGVAVRISPQGASGEIEAVVELYHRDPSLRVRLARNEDPSAIAADWQGWGKRLLSRCCLSIGTVPSPSIRSSRCRCRSAATPVVDAVEGARVSCNVARSGSVRSNRG